MRSISAAMALYALCLSALIVPESRAQKIRPESRSRKTESQQNVNVKSEGKTPNVIQSPTSSQIDIVGPSGSVQFGTQVYVLPNGNIVVTDPNFSSNFGAVYLYDGGTLELISTLRGSKFDDRVGSQGVRVLANGNFIVVSPLWDFGSVIDAGAVTLCSATSGCDGVVSTANSIHGSTASERLGDYAMVLLSNGNYVLRSPGWDSPSFNDAGAITWARGEFNNEGIAEPVGPISAANSLVGTRSGDVGGGAPIHELANGNYVVANPNFDDGSVTNAGAVTWCDGSSGCVGAISSSNSLVGTTLNDTVGSGNISVLSNGNLVVSSPNWHANNYGATTWIDGTAGLTGFVSDSNSLVGTTLNDQVGFGGIKPLPNGNYVVLSPRWSNAGSANAGAVTWGSGTTGISGAVSAQNSLVGSSSNDAIGSGGNGFTILSDGDYVVCSQSWGTTDVGAATWASGVGGTVGAISAANSLIGSSSGNQVGYGGALALTNGNYVVLSPKWDNGPASEAGAVTWGDGVAGTVGLVSSSNSHVGSTANDEIGSGATALTNGNYVTSSFRWDNGSVIDAGAVTWGNGSGGSAGPVSPANSIVGSSDYDQVAGVYPLTNGNYVVNVSNWYGGGQGRAGAVRWASGSTGGTGPINASNSLVGAPNDRVGDGFITPLTNGNYVVCSPNWNNGSAQSAGAVTWGNGLGGTVGPVSAANSVVGSTTGDRICDTNLTALSNGNYVFRSSSWDNGTFQNAGALTWGNGNGGTVGPISPDISLVGTTANDALGSSGATALPNGNFIYNNSSWSNGGSGATGAVTYGAGGGPTIGPISSENSVFGATYSPLRFSTVLSNERLVVGLSNLKKVVIFNPTYKAVADGNWSAAGTWNYGTFSKAHDVVIPSGRTVTLDGDVPGPGGSVTVESGGQLLVDGERSSASSINNAGVVDLSMGKLNMGANIFSSVCGAIENGTGAGNYVVGAANKEFCSPGSYTFPVGTADGYAPVEVNVTALNANPSSLTISSTAGVHPELSAPNSLGRFWSITESGDLTADFVFNYLDADVNGTESSYKLYRVAGGDPQLQTATLDAAANTMSILGVSEFSDWAIGNLAPTAAAVSVSGRVTVNARPVSGAIVLFTGADGAVRAATTNTFGHYRVDGLAAGFGYVASVVSRRYSFESQYVELTDHLTGLDFTER